MNAKFLPRIEPLEARIAPAFSAVFELSGLDGSNGFKISGAAAGDYSGASVNDAGDVNGDGFGDLLIGAQRADAGGPDRGAAYVVFGKAGGFGANLNLAGLNGTTGFKISGEADGDLAGDAVSAAGDINHDGFDDVLIAASQADPNGIGSGAAYVVFGKAGGFSANLNLSSLDGVNGFKLSGVAGGDLAGSAVSGAGDVNGDGFDDVIVGARYADPIGSASGTSYVVFGKAAGFNANLNLASLDGISGFKIHGEATDDRAGESLGSIGDLNGDGFADLFIGAGGNGAGDPGAAYVVFGKATGFTPNLSLSTLNGATGFKLVGVQNGDQVGTVNRAGDVNRDGFEDLIVGAQKADPNGLSSGAAYVVFGKASGFGASLALSILNGANGFKISGAVAGDYAGQSVSRAGDVNGDGFDDLFVGALAAGPNGALSGASYVIFGKNTGFGANLNVSTLDGTNGFKLNGVAAGDNAGAVRAAGDVNGDGIADLLIGARSADPGGLDSGASYVVFGQPAVAPTAFAGNLNLAALTGTNGFKISGVATYDSSGGSVSGAGDINGDGIADLIVGARGANSNAYNAGASYVVFGNRGVFAPNLNLSTLTGGNGFKISGVAARDISGGSVSGAGDINGDGIDDLIVGASGANPNGSYSGASYVVFGSRSAFAPNLNLSTLTGSNGFKIGGVAADDLFGYSVSGAGDINGDGIDDLIVGARNADPNGIDSGASYVVFGSRSGFVANLILSTLTGSNGFKISGGTAGERSGVSVSGAGDINGDGIDDLIVGADGISGSLSGASYVVFGSRSAFAPNLNLSTLTGPNGFKISGERAGDRFGISVSGAGDLNGDGIDDLIVGARSAAPNGFASGASYVVFGSRNGFVANLILSTLTGGNGFKISGAAEGDDSGVSVSGAGDISGDGVDDLIVGAYVADSNGNPQSGASYVVFGRRSGFAANLNLSTLTGSNGFKLSGIAEDDYSGRSVSGAGDLNGDGIDDLIVGAPRGDPNGIDSGASYVVFGHRAPAPPSNTEVSLVTGNLLVNDGVGGGHNDLLTISVNGANFRFSDPGGITAGSGATTINANTVEVPIVNVTGAFVVNTSGGADSITFSTAFSTPGNLTVDTGTGSDSITINGALTIGGNTTLTSAGGIAFNNSVTMAVNRALTATAGTTVTIGAALTTGGTGQIQLTGQDVTGAGNIATGGGLTVSTTGTASTLAGRISGSGFLTKTGTGTLVLSGANNYTGATNLNEGTIRLGHLTALGTTAGPTIVASGATLDLNGQGVADAVSLSGSGASFGTDATTIQDGSAAIPEVQRYTSPVSPYFIAFNGISTVSLPQNATAAQVQTALNALPSIQVVGGVGVIAVNPTTFDVIFAQPGDRLPLVTFGARGALISNSAGPSSLNGTVTLAAATNVNANGGIMFLIGQVTGPGDLIKSGSANLVFGNDTNDFSGLVTVNAGTITVFRDNGLGSAVAGTVINAGELRLQVPSYSAPESLTFNGGRLNSVAAPNVFAGPITLNVDIDIDVANQPLTLAGAISGGFGFTKVGPEVLTLIGPKTYTGLTTVSVGTLTLNGSIAGSATVAAGATLGGTGTIGGSVTNSGTVQPGGSGAAGTLTITGAYRQGAGGALAIEIGGTAGPKFDQLSVGGSATLGGSLDVTFLDGFTPPAGSSFALLTASPRTGTFGGVSGPLLAQYNADNVTLLGPPLPTLSIGDTSLAEGNSGAVLASFTVSLSAASSQSVTLQYETADGTASAPGDYAASGLTTLIFAPGEVTKTVTVAISGDALFEPNETFFVNLVRASNATITDGQGQATIVDDEVLPALSIDDVSMAEGASGTVTATFTVSLSGTSVQPVTVQYATADGTASASSDYAAVALTTLTFAPGEVTKTVVVTLNGDTDFELNETFFVSLSSPGGATIADAQGEGTIGNDDVVISPDSRSATLTDMDGDQLNVTTNKGTLTDANFVFAADGTLQMIQLTGATFNQANLTFTAAQTPGGNGRADVPVLDATGVDLGKVAIDGALGMILAGDGDPNKPALKKLTAGSLGTSEAGAAAMRSEVRGAIGELIVRGDVNHASLAVFGRLGSVSIGGSLLGQAGSGAQVKAALSGRGGLAALGLNAGVPEGIFGESIGSFTLEGNISNAAVAASGTIDSVVIKGDVAAGAVIAAERIPVVKVLRNLASDDPANPVIIAVVARGAGQPAIDKLIVRGDVKNARILLGYKSGLIEGEATLLAKNADARVGKIKINGNWSASSLVAGVLDATGDGFGQNDTLFAGDSTPEIVARIARIVIKGTAIGSVEKGDHFGISAQSIGKLSIGGKSIELKKNRREVLLDVENGDFRAVEVVPSSPTGSGKRV